jgi:hypothetical protein
MHIIFLQWFHNKQQRQGHEDQTKTIFHKKIRAIEPQRNEAEFSDRGLTPLNCCDNKEPSCNESTPFEMELDFMLNSL